MLETAFAQLSTFFPLTLCFIIKNTKFAREGFIYALYRMETASQSYYFFYMNWVG